MNRSIALRVGITAILAATTGASAFEDFREARLPDSGTPLIFHTVANAQDQAVIRDIVARAEYDSQARDLVDTVTRGELRIADIDINRDGTPEYFVMNRTPKSCNANGCATQLFWLFDGKWVSHVHYMMREGEAWGTKRAGFRDYVVYTGTRREIFPFLEGRQIDARPLQTEEERIFARKQLERDMDMTGDTDFPGWPAAIDGDRVRIAEADLDDDGQTERFLITSGYGLCGTIGCEALLLRKSGKTWRKTTSLSLSDGFLLLDDKKSGWHRIFTGEEIYTFGTGGTFFESVDLDDAEIDR